MIVTEELVKEINPQVKIMVIHHQNAIISGQIYTTTAYHYSTLEELKKAPWLDSYAVILSDNQSDIPTDGYTAKVFDKVYQEQSTKSYPQLADPQKPFAVGDRVTLLQTHGSIPGERYLIETIQKITRSGRLKTEKYEINPDLSIRGMGNDPWSTSSIVCLGHVTKEHLDIIESNIKLRKLKNKVASLTKPVKPGRSYIAQLEDIINIIETLNH
jgi:hypothetical protein